MINLDPVLMGQIFIGIKIACKLIIGLGTLTALRMLFKMMR